MVYARWCPQLSQPLWRKCSDSEDCQLDTPGIAKLFNSINSLYFQTDQFNLK